MDKATFLSRIEGVIDISKMSNTQQANKWFLMFGETAIFSSTGDLLTGTVIGLFKIHITNPPTSIQFKQDGTRVDVISDSVAANALSQLQYTGVPPVPLPGVYDDICSWIASIGGKTAVRSLNVMDIIRAYKGEIEVTAFIPGSTDVAGVVQYYKGRYTDGDELIIC